MSFVVAIDGPVAAGKGTIARKLAEHYGFAHLDTGALYRAVAARLLREGKDPDDVDAAVQTARTLDDEDRTAPDLRAEATGLAASKVAAYPDVRAALLDFQRNFAANPPGNAKGAVLEGRDVTTVVCPQAPVKIFITAEAEARARRRFDELTVRSEATNYDQVLADLRRRDDQDASRSQAPLKKAEDADLLDTTNLDIDSAFKAACEIIDLKYQV